MAVYDCVLIKRNGLWVGRVYDVTHEEEHPIAFESRMYLQATEAWTEAQQWITRRYQDQRATA